MFEPFEISSRVAHEFATTIALPSSIKLYKVLMNWWSFTRRGEV